VQRVKPFNLNQHRGFTILELIVVIIIISILGLFAIDRIWSLRIAAEQASVTQIAGNIRSALGLEVARLALDGKMPDVAKLENSNPITLLAQVPGNYIGEKENEDLVTEPGTWYFDKKLKTLTYNVIYKENFVTGLQGIPRIRYRIKLIYYDKNNNKQFDLNNDSIGGLDLIPLEKFSWNTNLNTINTK
jgi:general secretion pathway protein G